MNIKCVSTEARVIKGRKGWFAFTSQLVRLQLDNRDPEIAVLQECDFNECYVNIISLSGRRRANGCPKQATQPSSVDSSLSIRDEWAIK